jgi:hypothetical protein
VSLRQAFAHCAIFPAAASRRSLSPSVADRPLRPAIRRSLGELLPHQLADRTRAHLSSADLSFYSHARNKEYQVLIRVSSGYPCN